MATALMVLLIVFTNAAGDVLITRGMKDVGDVSASGLRQGIAMARQALCSRHFMLGFLCLAASFFAFLAVLSWADLSVVVPATSIVYVVTLMGAKFFLNEEIDRMRWAGTVLVCLGVALVCIP